MCYYEIEVHHVAMATGQTVNSKEIRIDLSSLISNALLCMSYTGNTLVIPYIM